jgi:hypothetical protein
MWTPWRIRARGTPVSGRRRSTLRLQIETLEDRLAPHCTLPAVAQGDLPFGIPVVACTADEPNAAPAAEVFTTDIAGLGLDGAVRLTVVFHFAGTESSSAPVLEYFDSAAGTWRSARASAEVAGAFRVDAARGAITIVFDETSSPSLASLNGRMFRVANAGALASLAIAGGTPVSAGSPQQPAPPGGVSGFLPPSPITAAPFTFDTRGALTPADHGIQPEIVVQTHAAFWSDPTAAEALDSGDPAVDPVPPIDPSADLPMMAWRTDEAAVLAAALSEAASGQGSQHNAGAEHDGIEGIVLIPAPAITREVIVERTLAEGGPARLVLAFIVFGWSSLRGPKLLDRAREGHISRRQTNHPDRRPGPLWHPRHSTTIARAPPRTRKR